MTERQRRGPPIPHTHVLPWWRSWWALSLAGVALTGATVGVVWLARPWIDHGDSSTGVQPDAAAVTPLGPRAQPVAHRSPHVVILSDKIVCKNNMLTTFAVIYCRRTQGLSPALYSTPGVCEIAWSGKSKDPKGTRITVRISDKDMRDLQSEAKRRNISVGGVIRTLIRDGIRLLEPAKR